MQDGTSTSVQNEKQAPVDEGPMTKLRLGKNLAVVTFSCVLLFTAYSSLQNLQSSLNKAEGLGTAGVAIIYGCFMVSSFLIPSFVISRLGCKWSIALFMLCYSLYVAANMYPVWATVVPASIILGVSAAVLWTALCTYISQIGTWYAKRCGASKQRDITSRFFALFQMGFETRECFFLSNFM